MVSDVTQIAITIFVTVFAWFAELIKAGGRTIRGAIHKLIIAIWNKEELPEEWKESVIRRGIKQSVITIGAYHF